MSISVYIFVHQLRSSTLSLASMVWSVRYTIINSIQDHFWSPFLMVYVVTSITISIFNIEPILNIQLHSWQNCKCNYQRFLKNLIYDIGMPYKILWLFLKVFHKTNNLIVFHCFLIYLVLLIYIYIYNHVSTANLNRNVEHTKYVQEKRILRASSININDIFHIFVHTRYCDLGNKVGVEPVTYINNDRKLIKDNQMKPI